MAVEGAPLSAEAPRPAYLLMVRGEEEQKTKRVQGKPIDKVLDSDDIQVVRGGFIPCPGGVVMGEYIAAAIGRLQNCTPFSKFHPAMRQPVRQRRPSRHYQEIIPESVEGLLPGTDEGKQKVSRVTRHISKETKPSSQNSVADTCAYDSVDTPTTCSKHTRHIKWRAKHRSTRTAHATQHEYKN